jgi:fructose-bisphosphate aldolase class II/6-phospho-5-dehydro-2-deoxy-D-gluconate aldolase
MHEIKEAVTIPLVLHGGSGIPDYQIQEAIKNGICKLNINTELQLTWSQAVRKFLNENNDVYDPRKIIKSGENAIKNTVNEKVTLLNSTNQA